MTSEPVSLSQQREQGMAASKANSICEGMEDGGKWKGTERLNVGRAQTRPEKTVRVARAWTRPLSSMQWGRRICVGPQGTNRIRSHS